MINYQQIRIGSRLLIDKFYLLVFVYITIAALALYDYMIWQSVNVLLGIIALPLVTVVKTGHKKSWRYGIACLLTGSLCWLLPVKTLLFLSMVFAVLFAVESYRGKTNLLPLLVIALMSPFFQYLANVFSFSVRLQLTDWATRLMRLFDLPVHAQGNMIIYHGNEFSVDVACMGLSMLVTSFLLQVMLIAVYQKKYKLQLPVTWVLLMMAAVIPLNMLANLFRIIFLVQWNLLPDNWMHEVTGIICLIAYVLLPALLVTRWLIRTKGRPESASGQPAELPPNARIRVHLVLIVVLAMAAFHISKHGQAMNDTSGTVMPVPGYATQRVAADIIKLENKEELVYLKSIPGFYSADHNPMICWRGSGYEFKQFEQRMIGNAHVYTALLQNGKDQLYTAWWYDNGSKQTINQLSWRWDVLKGGHHYSIVNVTAAGKNKLEQAVADILQTNRFKKLL